MSGRRRFLVGASAILVLPAAFPARAQQVLQLRLIEPLIRAVTQGAKVQTGRVRLVLPQLADNGNAVPLVVTVDSPMSATDHVLRIHLIANRNPVAEMATFHLGPRAGIATVETRIRLAGSQTISAIAALSDGSFWMDSASIVVTMSACVDET